RQYYQFPEALDVDRYDIDGTTQDTVVAVRDLALSGLGDADDVAFTRPWGFDLDDVGAPVLLVQGEGDRVVPRRHAAWMLSRLPDATLWMRLDDGHVSVLDVVPDAMDWLLDHAR
ncbi:alpha/beta fold hydrolase, partial [Agromyces humi]|uniref:alpha/beta fold hydrolase n=1 Tax=Agromyces humi TaxID=1766800 RepID=UPI001396C886